MKLQRGFLAAIAALSAVCASDAVAAGQNAIPYTNTFEGYSVGYQIATDNGWFAYRDLLESGVVTNWTDHGLKSPYVPLAAHTKVLDVAGCVSNVYTKDDSINYVFVDVMVRPEHRTDVPVFSSRPDVAAFVNSQSNLVFYHCWWDSGYAENSGYRSVWSTNNEVLIPSNEWVRLTFTITYRSTLPAYNDSYYRIQVNGGAVFTNALGYLSPDPANGEPDTGSWFMCGNLPNAVPDWISSFSVIGFGQVDDFVTSTSAPPSTSLWIGDAGVPEPSAGTTNLVVPVVLNSPSTSEVTVNFATSNGTAVAGSDYVTSNGTLRIPAGMTTGSITVVVNGDTSPEGAEYFYVLLSGAVNASIGDGQGVCMISESGFTSHGTPYSWLEANGLVPPTYEVADTNDFDFDGMAAYEEYWAGTNPKDSNSLLKIIAVTTNFTIRFLGGTNLSNPDFYIHRSTNITTPDAWNPLPFGRFPRANGVLGTNTWTDTNGHLYAPRVYYRVAAPTNTP